MLNMIPDDYESSSPRSKSYSRREGESKSEFKSGNKENDLPESPNYFNWRETFPELEIIYYNKSVILEEMKQIQRVRHVCYKFDFLFISSFVIPLFSVGSMARRSFFNT
jgi:hypothetical protein